MPKELRLVKSFYTKKQVRLQDCVSSQAFDLKGGEVVLHQMWPLLHSLHEQHCQEGISRLCNAPGHSLQTASLRQDISDEEFMQW